MVEEQVYKMESKDSQGHLAVFKVYMTMLSWSMWGEEQGEEDKRKGSQVQSQEGKRIKEASNQNGW